MISTNKSGSFIRYIYTTEAKFGRESVVGLAADWRALIQLEYTSLTLRQKKL